MSCCRARIATRSIYSTCLVLVVVTSLEVAVAQKVPKYDLRKIQILQVLMLYFQLTVRYSKLLASGPPHLVPKVSP